MRNGGFFPLWLFHAHLDFVVVENLAEVATTFAEKPWLELTAAPEGYANVHVFAGIGAATEVDAAHGEGVGGHQWRFERSRELHCLTYRMN